MSKRDVDRKVAAAMRQHTATKEEAIRDYAATLDEIESVDRKLHELNQHRNELIDTAHTNRIAAKHAGWKLRELTDTGLSVPRPLTLPLHQASADTDPTVAPGAHSTAADESPTEAPTDATSDQHFAS